MARLGISEQFLEECVGHRIVIGAAFQRL
jgi:hypothetical protein